MKISEKNPSAVFVSQLLHPLLFMMPIYKVSLAPTTHHI